MTLYRCVTADDMSAFCHKTAVGPDAGWVLHGGRTCTFDAADGVMRCGQAVLKGADSSNQQ